MSKKYANRWTYGATTIIFFFASVINFWMIVADELTTFRLIAAIAFLVGGILFLTVFIRVRRLG